jgi:RNA polymerase sigma factor (sigma-70 family)
MEQESTTVPIDAFSTQFARLIDALHDDAKCARWGLSRTRFADALRRSVEKRFSDGRPKPTEVEAYLKSLHIEDLALACACGEGLDAAWEFFVAHFRQELRAAAAAIVRTSSAGDDTRARDLADSIYAELYGVTATGSAQRNSLFAYFHGRSKLSTWLRAVLAQRHVDLLRKDWRTVSLEAEEEKTAGKTTAVSASKLGANNGRANSFVQRVDSSPPDPNRQRYLARLDRALRAAIAELGPRERMLLACYYVDQLTLAEIGRTLGEHESTVSRQLDRTRRDLREVVTKTLLQAAAASDGCAPEAALDQAQVELAFEYALEDWPFDLSRALSNNEAAIDPAKP